MVTLVYFALLLVAFFFFIVRPQRARAAAARELQAQLAPGASVVTTSGLHGVVADVADDTVGLEIAPGVTVRFAKAAIGRIADATPDPAIDVRDDAAHDSDDEPLDVTDAHVEQDSPRP